MKQFIIALVSLWVGMGLGWMLPPHISFALAGILAVGLALKIGLRIGTAPCMALLVGTIMCLSFVGDANAWGGS